MDTSHGHSRNWPYILRCISKNETYTARKKNFTLSDRGGVIDKDKPWYVKYWHNGKRVRVYGDINTVFTVEERIQKANRIIRQLKKEFDQVPKALDHREAVYKVLEFEQPHLRKKSYQTYKSKIDKFFEWLGNDELTTEKLRLYFKLYRQSHTQQGTYDARRMLMTFFKKAGIGHLLEPIKIKKGNSRPLSYFQPHQSAELMDYMKEHDPLLHLHCLFIYYTAIRPRSELVNIRVDDIFITEKKIAIRGEIAKTGRTEFVRIPPRFFRYIDPLKSLKPRTYIFSSARDPYKPAGRNTYGEKFRAVLNHFGYGSNNQLYSWKHTGAIAVYKATKNIMALKDHCRHKDVSTTQLYLRQLGLDDYDEFYDMFPAPEEWG